MGDKDTTPVGVVRGKMEWDDWGKGRGQRKEPPPAANKKRWNEKGGTHTPVCAWPRVWCLIRVCVTEIHPTVRARAFLFFLSRLVVHAATLATVRSNAVASRSIALTSATTSAIDGRSSGSGAQHRRTRSAKSGGESGGTSGRAFA